MPASFAFDAYVGNVLFVREGAAFALGDGTVRFAIGEGAPEAVAAHEGAVLCAAPHPSGSGVVTGGDDGRLVWSRPGADGAVELANLGSKWIDAVACSAQSGLIAFAAGREVHVRDLGDPKFTGLFRHERSVADLAFDPKGRRLAAATYGGVQLRYARIAEQKPTTLKWAGAHIALAWSPDGKFLVSAMQENALHGWRLTDAKDMRMGGYPAKVKSFAWASKGALLATSGADGVVAWPFTGANGPMGKEAAVIGADDRREGDALVTRVAASGSRVCAGMSDGRIWSADLQGRSMRTLRPSADRPVSALAVSGDGRRLAWGDEAGASGLVDLA